jgi:hypothetical protein
MQAIEIEARIDEQGEIHIKLPQRRPPGPARVIVLLDGDQDAPVDREEANDFAGIWGDLPDADFEALLRETEERRRSAFATRPHR